MEFQINTVSDLLAYIKLDTKTFTRGGITLGDSAVGEFIDPNTNQKYIIKRSKKEDSTRATNQSNNDHEIINDILTEYFISLIGENFSTITVCKYELAKYNGLLRISSKNFLLDNQFIFHGRELFENFYDLKDLEDPRNKKFPSIYLISNIEKHLRIWSDNLKKNTNPFQILFNDFLKMCFWDAIIGNNDRHLQNWGIITSLEANHIPCFTPIFDTARAFKWNVLDTRLERKSVSDYSRDSYPHVGIKEGIKLNHYDFINELTELYPYIIPDFKKMLDEANKIDLSQIIKNDSILSIFFSEQRKKFISECYLERIKNLNKLFKNAAQVDHGPQPQ